MNLQQLSQRDPRWKDISLGTSKTTTIGSHGCTITCIAMLAGITPDDVNKRLLSVGGYANTNLVIWQKIEQAIPWLRWEFRGYGYDNTKVAQSLPCLVEVDGKRIGAPRHWVLYVGNQQMHDPWYGNIKSTSYYPPTGYSIIKVIGNPPKEKDMSDGTVSVEAKKFEELVTKATERDEYAKQFQSPAQAKQLIDSLKQDVADANQSRKEQELRAESIRKTLNEQIASLATILDTRQDFAEIKANLEGTIDRLEELSKYKEIHLDDSRKWAESELTLKTEINRLSALLKDKDVLANVELSELIRELIKRFKGIILRAE